MSLVYRDGLGQALQPQLCVRPGLRRLLQHPHRLLAGHRGCCGPARAPGHSSSSLGFPVPGPMNGDVMVVLTAAVVVVGVLCLLDLLLTFGVIRRLREHTELLSVRPGADLPVIGVNVGEAPAAFTGLGTDGAALSGPAGLRMVAFFSSFCSICPKRVPVFLDYLRANQVRRDDVLAVVVGPADEPVPYLDRLAEAALVCTEPEDGALARAFKVEGFPAFCLLDTDGAVLATSYDPAVLPEPVTA